MPDRPVLREGVLLQLFVAGQLAGDLLRAELGDVFRPRVVNVSTGKELSLVSGGSVRLNLNGPVLHVSIRGPIIFFFFFPGDAGPGDITKGTSYYFHGNVDGDVDLATGLGLSFEFNGRADDLCAALAT